MTAPSSCRTSPHAQDTGGTSGRYGPLTGLGGAAKSAMFVFNRPFALLGVFLAGS